jgi:ATP-binding cassette subfamily C (CFTR/MRP) protein 1
LILRLTNGYVVGIKFLEGWCRELTLGQIQKTILSGFEGKTLLCIAHRLTTIINYDRICVMDAGQIAELDRPLALYEQGGIFRSMCERSGISREDFQASR